MAGTPVQDEYAELADLYESSADPRSLNYVRPSPPVSPDDELVGPGAPEPRFSADRLAQQYEAGPLDENTLAEWVQLTARQNRKREAPERLPKQFAARFPVLGEEFFEQGAGADTPRAAFQRWHDIYRRANDYAGTGVGADIRAKRAAERDAAELDQEGLEMLAFAVNDLAEAERPALRESYGVKVARGLSRGGMAVAEGARRMSRPFSFLQTQSERRQRGLQERQEDRAAELMGIREQADPLTGGMEGGSFLTPEGWKGFASGKFAVQAAEQIPTQAASTALDVLTGGTSRIPQVAFWYDQIKPDEVRALRRMGVNQRRAEQLGSVSALLQAMIETIEKNPLLPKKASEAMGEFGKKQVRKIVSSAAKRYAKELSEEYLQGVVSESTRTLAEAIEKKAPGVGRFMLGRIGEIHGGALQQAAEAAGPLALMMGPIGVVQARMESRAGYSVKQLDDLMRGAMTLDRTRATDPDAKYRPYEFVGPPTPIDTGPTEYVTDTEFMRGDVTPPEIVGADIAIAADRLYSREYSAMRKERSAEVLSPKAGREERERVRPRRLDLSEKAAALSSLGQAWLDQQSGVRSDAAKKYRRMIRLAAEDAVEKIGDVEFPTPAQATAAIDTFVETMKKKLDREFPNARRGAAFANRIRGAAQVIGARQVFTEAGNYGLVAQRIRPRTPTQETPNAQESPPEAGQVREESGAQGQAEEGVRVRDTGQAEAQERVLKPDTKRAKDELDEALFDFLKESGGPGGPGSTKFFDPKLLALGARVVRSAVKLGTLRFRDFLTQLAQRIGTRAVRATAGLWEQVWNDTRAADNRLDEAKDAQAIADAMPDQEPEAEVARPDLAHYATNQQAARVEEVSDKLRNMALLPDRHKDAEITNVANARLDADFDGEVNRLFKLSEEGQILHDLEQNMAYLALNRLGLESMVSADVEQKMLSLALAARESKSEAGRSLRVPPQLIETPTQFNHRNLIEHVLMPSERKTRAIARARDALRKRGTPAAKKRLQKLLESRKGDVPELLRLMAAKGIGDGTLKTFARIVREAAKDDATAIKLAKRIREIRSGWPDKIFEWFRNNLMFGLGTFAINFTSNKANFLWIWGVKAQAEILVNSALGRRDGLTIEGYRAAMDAFVPALSRGLRNAVMTWDTETSWLDHTLERTPFDKWDIRSGSAIHGFRFKYPVLRKTDGKRKLALRSTRYGRVHRTPQRFNQMVDDLDRTVNYEMYRAAEAYRIADTATTESGENLFRTQEEIGIAMRQMIEDPRSAASMRAYELSKEAIFGSDPSVVGRAFLHLRRVPLLRYITPFVVIADNMFRLGFRQGQAGALALTHRAIKQKFTEEYEPADFPRWQAEQLIAWSVLIGLAMMYDPDDPPITGNIPVGDLPRNSVKMPRGWQSYNDLIGPLGIALSMTADALRIANNVFRRGASVQDLREVLDGLAGLVENRTYLRQVGDLMELLRAHDKPEKLAKFAANFSSGFIPSRPFGHIVRADRDFAADRGIWGYRADWLKMLAKRTIQRMELPFVSRGLPDFPRYDNFGYPMSNGISPVPGTDFLWRVLYRDRTIPMEMHVGNRVLLAWNNAHPDDMHQVPEAIEPYWEDRSGKNRALTEQQKADYGQTAGLVARMIADGSNLNTENPPESDAEYVREIIFNSRKAVRDALKPYWERGESALLPPEQFANMIRRGHVGHRVEQLTALKPASITTSEKEGGITLEWKRADWQTKRDAAAEWLRNRGMTQAEARELYRTYLQDSGDIRRITTATGRLEKINDRIRAFNRAWRQNVER